MFDYFYGIQSEQFAFYRIPKVLFTDDRFRVLSAEAKTLYGILLDRVTLSVKNGWIDQQGRVYIIYTIEEIMADMNCGNKKAIQLLSDLEEKVGLIERKRQGLGKPNLIYVKNFISVESHGEGHFLNCQKYTSGNAERTSPEMAEGHGRNTDTSNTEDSDIDSFSSDRTVGERSEAMRMLTQYQTYFRESLEMDTLAQDSSLDQEALSAMVDLKMDEIGIRNKSSYLRKMALDGYCVNLELEDVKEMVSLLRYCSNNLNQYAKRANESGSIYAEDIRDLQQRQEEIWEIAKEILARLATIQ